MSEPKRFVAVRNLERYQHYRDRRPPWVKLHGEILENYDFAQLPDAMKYHALALLLLAARMDNRMPADGKWLASKINAMSKIDVEELVRVRFLTYTDCEHDGSDLFGHTEQDASESLATRKQSAMSETETETETEKRVAALARGEPRKVFDPLGVELPAALDTPTFRSAWELWCDHRREIRKRLTPKSVEQQLRKLAEIGDRRAAEAIRHTVEKGWQGIREPDRDRVNGAPPQQRRPPDLPDLAEHVAAKDARFLHEDLAELFPEGRIPAQEEIRSWTEQQREEVQAWIREPKAERPDVLEGWL